MNGLLFIPIKEEFLIFFVSSKPTAQRYILFFVSVYVTLTKFYSAPCSDIFMTFKVVLGAIT